MKTASVKQTNGAGRIERKAAKIIFKRRMDLHNAIVKRMRELKFCTAAQIVEDFKRWYLWDYHNVETSKALSLQGLNDAIDMLSSVVGKKAYEALMLKHTSYEKETMLVKATIPQSKKITAVAKHRLKLSIDSLTKYAAETLKRQVYVGRYHNPDCTIKEADYLIKRLEGWEARALKKSKK